RFKNTGTKTVVISEAIKKEFLKLGFNEKNILIAPDGVDLEKFDLSISKEEARKKVGLLFGKKIVMYTGHLFPWKGVDILAEAAQLLQDVDFIFIGGTEYDIQKFKNKYQKVKNIKILGHKPHKEVPIYLKAADILVLPNSAKEEISSKYTSPLKLFEYMASGRPIVASDLLSTREVLNESNSVLVKPDNPEALVEGIKSALANAKLAEKISDQALKDVQDHTWRKRAEKIITYSALSS
ncbi:MAG: glycosyl transferase family 1, partial [Candidatus Yanofskybacteria bacterium CG10_big_fil_rev_8_21_14_0_10_37_15]